MTTGTNDIPRGDAGANAGGVQGTRPAGHTIRHLRVIDGDDTFSDAMIAEAARQRVRADRAEAKLERALSIAQSLLDELSGTVAGERRGPGDVW